MAFARKKVEMPTAARALKGRPDKMPVPEAHFVNGNRIEPPFPDGMETALFAMGCFWGPEKRFWETDGVYSTAAGYAGGFTPNPSYDEVCSGRTGHTEAVLVVYDPSLVTYEMLVKVFWEGHDPTQGMRQAHDVGTQYRSAAFFKDAHQRDVLERSRAAFQERLTAAGYGEITTEIRPADTFYYGEPYHQQYLAWNPNGFCGVGGTGVSCPTGVARTD